MKLIVKNHPWTASRVYRPVNANRWTPAVNVKETEGSFEVALAVPGLRKEDFKLAVEDNRLTISAEQETKNEGNHERFTRKEFNFQSFKRSFLLPDTVNSEGISASYENGILKVELPKVEPEVIKREIVVA
ncbi:MAG: Hsp20/alpha crystallin family protein [Bacteroidota bacterium]